MILVKAKSVCHLKSSFSIHLNNIKEKFSHVLYQKELSSFYPKLSSYLKKKMYVRESYFIQVGRKYKTIFEIEQKSIMGLQFYT